MEFVEAFLCAHSSDATEAELVGYIVELLKLWEDTELLPEGSHEQLNKIEEARGIVELLKQEPWNISGSELGDLEPYADDFRKLAPELVAPEDHQEAC